MANPRGRISFLSSLLTAVGTWVEWQTESGMSASAGAVSSVTGTGNAFLEDIVNSDGWNAANDRNDLWAFDLKCATAPTNERRILKWDSNISGANLAGYLTLQDDAGVIKLRLYDKDDNLLGTFSDEILEDTTFRTVFLRMHHDSAGPTGLIQCKVTSGGTPLGSGIGGVGTLSYDPRTSTVAAHGITAGFYNSEDAGNSPSITLKFFRIHSSGTDSFLGPGTVGVAGIKPNADGDLGDWSANTGSKWAAVDDNIGGPDDDTTYITDIENSSEVQQTFKHVGGISFGTSRVEGMMFMQRTKKTAAGGTTLQLLVKAPSDTIYKSGVGQSVNESWSWYSPGTWKAFATTDRPESAARWTESEFNNLQWGYESITLGAVQDRITVMFFYYEMITVDEVTAGMIGIVADKVVSLEDKDTYIEEGNGTTNFGTATTMDVGFDSLGKNSRDELRILVREAGMDDAALDPPSGESYDEVVMCMYVVNVQGSVGTLDFKRCTDNWVEATVTWNNISGGTYTTPQSLGIAEPAIDLWYRIDAKAMFEDARDNRSGDLNIGLIDPSASSINYVSMNTDNHATTHLRPILCISFLSAVAGGRRRRGQVV